jgi:hypothetical protein
MTTVVGMFENPHDADRAISDLRSMGLPREALGVMGQQNRLQASTQKHEVGKEAGVGATGGATVGGIAGLLVGVGALAIPGLGPVIAAGTLGTVIGSTAVGAGVGAAAGGIVGALMGMGLSREEANVYAEAVNRGDILVSANVPPGQEQQVNAVLRRAGAVDVHARRQQFTNSGWQQFDASSQSRDTQTGPQTHPGP